VDPPRAGKGRQDRDDLLEQFGDRHGLRRDRHLAGLDAADVEDLVDQVEEMAASLEDVADARPLVVGQVVHLEQLGEAEDRGQRRPELVAHLREELRLCPVRPLGLLPRGTYLVLGLLPRGDVLGDPDQVQRPAGLVVDRDLLRVEDPLAVVGGVERLLRDVDDRAPVERLAVLHVEERRLFGRKEVAVRPADDLLARPADELFLGLVEPNEAQIPGVLHEYRNGNVLDHRI
jgi:hypothetical protein